MQTIAKKVVQNWAAKGYISDDEVEMCLYNLIRHTIHRCGSLRSHCCRRSFGRME